MSETRQGGKNKFPSRRQVIVLAGNSSPWWLEELKRISPDVYEALIVRVDERGSGK